MSFDRQELRERLKALADEKYRVFNDGLIPGGRESLGVRTPALRAIAKELAAGDVYSFLADGDMRYNEEFILKAMVIGQMKCTVRERLELIRTFVPQIENWAVCDVFCSGLKEARRYTDEYFALVCEYLTSREEYELRFAAVMLLEYFVTQEHIGKTLDIYEHMRHEGYYVKMAVAWGLSVCYVKFPEKTLALFKRRVLEPWTQNKAIQKCRESLRVSAEDKEKLLAYKIK